MADPEPKVSKASGAVQCGGMGLTGWWMTLDCLIDRSAGGFPSSVQVRCGSASRRKMSQERGASRAREGPAAAPAATTTRYTTTYPYLPDR